MIFLSLAVMAFGVVILVFPEFLAILVGVFFLFLGLNMLIMSSIMRSATKGKAPFSVGGYEIIRKK